MTEIELRDISKSFGQGASAVLAVDAVNLRIEPGEFFFLLGPSGCGKTTLLRIVAGLTDPSEGAVLMDGLDVTLLPVQDRGTALVFQNYALWPHMTVGQNVQFGPRMKRLPRAERQRIAGESLHRVQMDEFAARRPNQLSGGQQQRVALARALAAQPRCLLLDEPLSNLDARLRLHMRGELRRLVKDTGTTALYVTHDQKEALSMADRIAVMNGGRVVQVGPPAELYHRPASRFVADFLGEANFLDGLVIGMLPGGLPGSAGPAERIRTPVGELLAAAERPLATGQAVACCIRPEKVRIAGPTAPPAAAPRGEAGPGATEGGRMTESALAATVESETFLGETQQFVCILADGTRWRVTCFAGPSRAFTPGQKVRLHLAPQDVAILPVT